MSQAPTASPDPLPTPPSAPPLIPLFDKILLRRDLAVAKTEGGIEIPVVAQERPNTAIVVAVGEGRLDPHLSHQLQPLCNNTINPTDGASLNTLFNKEPRRHVEPLRVKVGDHVMFQSYAGTEIRDPKTKESFLLVAEDDILLIIKE